MSTLIATPGISGGSGDSFGVVTQIVSKWQGTVITPGMRDRFKRATTKKHCDIVVFGDSVSCARDDSAGASNCIQYRLAANILREYDPGRVHGLGFLSAAPPSNAYTNAQGTLDGWNVWKRGAGVVDKAGTGNNGPIGGLAVAIPAGGQLRMALPAFYTVDGFQFRSKRFEFVFSNSTSTTSFTYDVYSTGTQLAPADPFIAAGAATGITQGGVTGITGTVTSAANGATPYGNRSGLIPIVFDGTTQCPVLQVTGLTGETQLEGIIIYGDDHEEGVMVHGVSREGATIKPYGELVGGGDTTQGRGARRSFYGHAQFGRTNSPAVGGPIEIRLLGINDRLVNNVDPSYFEKQDVGYLDNLVAVGEDPLLFKIWHYCVTENNGAPAYFYDKTTISPTAASGLYPWNEMGTASARPVAAKYPNNYGFLNVQGLLGDLTYEESMIPRGWGTFDKIHAGGGYPAWLVDKFMTALRGGTSPGWLAQMKVVGADGPLNANSTTHGGPLTGFNIFNRLGGWLVPTTTGKMVFTGTPAFANADLQFEFRSITSGAAPGDPEIKFFLRENGANHYAFKLRQHSDSTTCSYWIYRNGVEVHSSAGRFTPDGTIYQFTVKVSGAVVTIIRDGVVMTTYTDPNGALPAGTFSMSTIPGDGRVQARNITLRAI